MTIKINKKTAFVFDLDDTLYNELDYLISAYIEIANRVDAKNEKLLFSVMFSLYRNNENVFEYLVKNYRVDKKELMTLYRNHFPKIKLQKGVKKLFKSILLKEAKIAIITDGRSSTQRNKLKALNILKYISFVSISEEVGSEKPSLIPFKLIMDKLPSENYFYIADNFKKDFIAPNKLGWNTIGIIDEGKNIHPNSYLYQQKENIPNHFVYKISQINIK
tara:strand:- start:252 stop:908 length:657 start_codon:yes stop_codon:yes gene_type:complete